MLVLAGWSLTACDESHSDFPEPVVYPQGEVINMTDITVDGELKMESVYNLNGQKVQNAKKGLYIVNGKKVVIK